MSNGPDSRVSATVLTASAITHTSKVVATRPHHLVQHVGSPLFVFLPIRDEHLLGVPEMLALGTEAAPRLKSLERDESVWGSASRTPDIGPRRRLRKQHHANPIYAHACRAQCPELNTSEFQPQRPACHFF